MDTTSNTVKHHQTPPAFTVATRNMRSPLSMPGSTYDGCTYILQLGTLAPRNMMSPLSMPGIVLTMVPLQMESASCATVVSACSFRAWYNLWVVRTA